MKTVLITGVSGLVGSHLYSRLIKNYNLTVISRIPSTLSEATSIQIDLSSEWTMEQLPENVDIVIHLAQSRNYKHFPNSAEDIFNVNTRSTLKLLDYARSAGVKTFIYTSTGGIYKSQTNLIDERSEINQLDDLGFYFASKLSSEMLAMNYTRYFDVQILRPFFIYGPGGSSNSLLWKLRQKIIDDEAIELHGENGISLNPIYVDDFCDSLLKLIETSKSRVLNIAGKEVVSIRELSLKIGRIIGMVPKFNHLEHKKSLVADVSKLESIIGTFYTTNLDFGLRKMLEELK